MAHDEQNIRSVPEPGSKGNVRMLFVMVAIGLICAFLIVLTYEQTRPVIERKQEEALKKAIFRVLPGIKRTISFVIADGQIRPATDAPDGVRVHAGYDDRGDLMGFAIEASGQGYADIIRLIYGYDHRSQKIIGIQVLETKETPGLGDRIEKDPAFLENFRALDVAVDSANSKALHPIETVKNGKKTEDWQIEGITGATISSRAVGDILGTSSESVLPVIRMNISKVGHLNQEE
ncbi:MAG: FMN-binding protein [Flavobacteriales bacterium]|nr:FMN-binding protein [Flavobacteriales bacterium]